MLKSSLAHSATRYIVTCEHAVNTVPPEAYKELSLTKELLTTHRGFDAGAMKVAQLLAKSLKTELFLSTCSRLVLDFNRSLKFAKTTKALLHLPTGIQRKVLLDYEQYRTGIWRAAKSALKKNSSLYYISVHSFTPVFNGKVRKTDIGLLFRTRNSKEKKWAQRIQKCLKKKLPNYTVHLNLPYRGHTDCLMVDLCEDIETNKKKWPKRSEEKFTPIFLELNQKHIKQFDKIAAALVQVFKELDQEDRRYLE